MLVSHLPQISQRAIVCLTHVYFLNVWSVGEKKKNSWRCQRLLLVSVTLNLLRWQRCVCVPLLFPLVPSYLSFVSVNSLRRKKELVSWLIWLDLKGFSVQKPSASFCSGARARRSEFMYARVDDWMNPNKTICLKTEEEEGDGSLLYCLAVKCVFVLDRKTRDSFRVFI